MFSFHHIILRLSIRECGLVDATSINTIFVELLWINSLVFFVQRTFGVIEC